MGKGRIVETYRKMATEEQAAYRAWLRRNLILSSLMAGAIAMMAAMGGLSRDPANATAEAGEVRIQQSQR